MDDQNSWELIGIQSADGLNQLIVAALVLFRATH